MAPPDITDLDLLDRARAGDRVAFDALVTTWSRPALALALTLCGDRKRARIATRNAFTQLWSALPAHHSRAPFRPLLLGTVARAAMAVCAPDDDRQNERIAGALAGLGYTPAEVALTLQIGARAARKAMKAAAGAPSKGVVDAAAALVGTVTLGALDEQIELVVRRRTQTPLADVWRALTDVRSVTAWIGESARVHPATPLGPGSRMTAIEVLGSGRATQHCHVTVVTPGRSLSWLASLRLGRGGGDVEQIWSVTLEPTDDGTELIHALRGHAVDRSITGRRAADRYADIEGSIAPSMHRRLARIASAAEATSRTAPL